MLNTFTFNGHSSDEFGIRIEKMPVLNRSARKFQVASVPGRNGNIYQLEDAWNEVVQPYQIFAGDSADGAAVTSFTEIMEWLHSADGYAVLTDTYDPTHYREAVFVDSLDIESAWHTFGRTTVNFRCRPERYLVGEPEAISNSSVIVNGTNHAAKPLIHLTGTNAANHMQTLYSRITTHITTNYLDTLPKNPQSRAFHAVGIDLLHEGRIPASSNGVNSVSSTETTYTYTALYSFGIGFPTIVRPNTQYTLSYNVTNNDHGDIDTVIYCFDRFNRYLGKSFYKHAAYDTDQFITFTTPADCELIMLLVTGDADTYTISNVMLAYGSAVFPYSEWHNPHEYFDGPVISINEVVVTINEDFLDCDIDCETEDVYLEGVLSNTAVSVTEYGELTPKFLTLKSGNNGVALSMQITGGTIDKRLWEL